MKLRKVIPVVLAAVMVFSLLCSGCGKKPDASNPVSTAPPAAVSTVDTKLTGGLVMPVTTENITYEWMLSEHPSFPVDIAKWEAFKKIQEITGVSIKLILIPDVSYEQKLQITLASGTVPDILSARWKSWASTPKKGTLLELSKYVNEKTMPNLSSILKKNPSINPQIQNEEGMIYYLPGLDSDGPSQSWLIRKDILDRENLKIPETMEQFIDVCRSLKKKYPGAYPITVRAVDTGNILGRFDTAYNMLVDPGTLIPVIDGKAKFTVEEPIVLQMVNDVRTLYAEGLLDSDYPIVQAKQWEERLLTGKAFMTYDHNTRAELFNSTNAGAGANKTEGYNLIRMLPPVPKGGTGKVPGKNPVIDRLTVFSDKIKNPEVVVKFIDFLYSPLGDELNEWGIEGKTFTRLPNGGRKFTDAVASEYNPNPSAPDRKVFGLNYNAITLTTGYLTGPNDQKLPAADAWVALCKEKGRIWPDQIKLSASESESSLWADKYSAIQKHYVENIDRFIMGKRPISEWNTFVNELKKLGTDDLIKIKQAQFDRANKK